MKEIELKKLSEQGSYASKCNCGSCNCNCGGGICINKCVPGSTVELRKQLSEIYKKTTNIP